MVTALVTDYRQRHKDIRGIFRQNYATANALIGELPEASEERRLLLGAYFTNEYSLESVALFNPSMVRAPRSERRAARLRPLRHEPARVRRGAHLVDRVPHRHGRRRASRRRRPADTLRAHRAPRRRRALRQGELRPQAPRDEGAPPARRARSSRVLDTRFTISDLKYAIERCRPRDRAHAVQGARRQHALARPLELRARVLARRGALRARDLSR